MKLKLVLLAALVSFGAVATASAATPRVVLSQQDAIPGLGEQFPIAKDVSRSRNFHVYVFKKDGISYVQINRLDGPILTAVALAGSGSFVLPVGELAASQVAVASGNAVTNAVATAGATCPCSGQVVYSGPEGTVIVIYGSDGTVIQVVVLPRKVESIPVP